MSVKTEPKPYRESHLRSILKGFSWRIVSTFATVCIAYVITGEVGDALRIRGYEFVIKLFTYYGHERAWQLVPRGTVRKVYSHHNESS